jgi:uncharacterized protein (DUF2249 family)
MTHDCSHTSKPSGVYPFDARGVGRLFRHATIFGALQALRPGEVMRFCKDHAPLPLLGRIDQLYGARVKLAYVSREPGQVIIDFIVAN